MDSSHRFTTATEQPPLIKSGAMLTVAISSLSIGGAERIVLDWAERIHPDWVVHLIVLRNREKEWPVPPFIQVTRLEDPERLRRFGTKKHGRLLQLQEIGEAIAASDNPVCVCHLLSREEREALGRAGVSIVNVLHNAKDGWLEGVSELKGGAQTIAVSESCRKDLRQSGYNGSVSVIRHIPPRLRFRPETRSCYRHAWNIPDTAFVIGMIGAVKPQKNYSLALGILKTLLQKKDAYLVVIGGPANTKAGRGAWQDVLNEINRLGVRHRVAMPGFIPNGSACLPAFDIVLNTSHFEGLSIATLEALISGIPVIASRVGGQGEIASEGLTLIEKSSPLETWAGTILEKMGTKAESPSWARFPSYRLWTLAALARPYEPSEKTLFVTANLNSGGAQRSLVNLTLRLKKTIPLTVAVSGNSTESHFYRELASSGTEVVRLSDSQESFVNAEKLVEYICRERFGTVCFWNLDAKVKLLAVKALGFTKTRFVEVSPGQDSFDKLASIREFEQLIAFSKQELYGRFDTVVMKFDGPVPALCAHKTVIIPNGVPEAKQVKTGYSIRGNPKVVINGRIAPTKFLLEIVEAMRLVREKIPNAELHVYGGPDPQNESYAESVYQAAKAKLGVNAVFYGVDFEAKNRLADFDAYVVLGKDQGCPNALLEALAAGLPSIGNDDGGTREQIIDGRTGLLIPDCSPRKLAAAIEKLLRDRKLARYLGVNGRKYATKTFSMERMTGSYLKLFSPPKRSSACKTVLHACGKHFKQKIAEMKGRHREHNQTSLGDGLPRPELYGKTELV